MKIKEKIKKIKSNIDCKIQLKNLKKEYKRLKEENLEKEKEIDRLEFLLDKDMQARKIQDLENANQHKWEVIHSLRKEIIQLKGK